MERTQQKKDSRTTSTGRTRQVRRVKGGAKKPKTRGKESADRRHFEAQAAEWKEKYTRLYADFENFRKRNAKERIAFLKTANEDLMVSLLPVLDDLERASLSVQRGRKSSVEEAAQGVALIKDKFLGILKQRGLCLMDTKRGDAVNVECLDVISQMDAPNESLKGKVLEVAERGYRLEDKIIRFAKVVVGR